jgi:hypothetical protein
LFAHGRPHLLLSYGRASLRNGSTSCRPKKPLPWSTLSMKTFLLIAWNTLMALGIVLLYSLVISVRISLVMFFMMASVISRL